MLCQLTAKAQDATNLFRQNRYNEVIDLLSDQASLTDRDQATLGLGAFSSG